MAVRQFRSADRYGHLGHGEHVRRAQCSHAWRSRTFAADEGADAKSTRSRPLISVLAGTARRGCEHRRAHHDDLQPTVRRDHGIMHRASFTLGNNEAFWVPFDFADDLSRAAVTRKQHIYECLARLKPRRDAAGARRPMSRRYPAASTPKVSARSTRISALTLTRCWVWRWAGACGSRSCSCSARRCSFC